MGTTSASEVLSTQDVAGAVGWSLDLLRAKIRADPALSALFVKLGRVRALPASRIDDVRRLLSQPAGA